MIRGALSATAVVVLAGGVGTLALHDRGRAATAVASTPCPAPTQDVTLDIIEPPPPTETQLLAAVKQRFDAVGVRCVELTVTPIVPAPPAFDHAAHLRMTWSGTADNYLSSFLLRDGTLRVRAVVGTSPAPCTGNPNLSGTDPAEIPNGTVCEHLGPAIAASARVMHATAIPGPDGTWGLSITLKNAPPMPTTVDVAMDGGSLGVATVTRSGRTTTLTTPPVKMDGGAEEARATAVDMEIPLPTTLTFFSITS